MPTARRRGRWVTGVGVGLAVLLVGGTFAIANPWWSVGLIAASVLIAVGIGARV